MVCQQQRKIIHVDMDAFFASVEQRDQPQLRLKPVVVGGLPTSRGVVAACSYEARQFGIHSAMPSSQAYRLCPHAIFVPPRIDAYREVSMLIRQIFWRFASAVEPLSLDEAYLDVSDSAMLEGGATRIAQAIKQAIFDKTRLTASAGVSYNKFLAKIASDMDKPNGLYVIKPEQGEGFVAGLNISKFYGVGPVTEGKMHRLGIKTGGDLRAFSRQELRYEFGKSADYFYNIARAIDLRPVRSNIERKSLGREVTFKSDVSDQQVLLEQIKSLSDEVWCGLQANKLQAKTVTLKVRYADFCLTTRARTQVSAIKDLASMQLILGGLLTRTDSARRAVRLIGVSASGLTLKEPQEAELRQLELF